MGKNNKARRAAKARDRRRNQRSGAGRPWWTADPFEAPPPSARDQIASLLHLAVAAPERDDDLRAGVAHSLASSHRSLVDAEIERHLLQLLSVLWDNGWQPAELTRQVRRTTGAAGGRLALWAVAADHRGRHPSTLDLRWAAQLERLGLPDGDGTTGWFRSWERLEAVERPDVVRVAVEVLRSLSSVGPLPQLLPFPGAGRGDRPVIDLRRGAEAPILERVRALLAQAESTSFPAEAEVFTAKAQELITRHAIDAALLGEVTADDELPVTVRLPLDDPYIDAKSLLLQVVAQHSRCRSVFHARYALSSVVGFADDVAATELLFTSLLVQAQSAMLAAAAAAPAGSRARSRSFRSSFLVAYAERVGQRLAEINAAVVSAREAEVGRSLLPVLAGRSSAVDDALEGTFGSLASHQVRVGRDAAGWARGRQAADLAQLSFADLTDPVDEQGSVLPAVDQARLAG
jgi:hypothetical protein